MQAQPTQAILAAYLEAISAFWPELHTRLLQRSATWAGQSEDELGRELEACLAEASGPGSQVRIFWKLGPDLRFGGCNRLFAEDAGVPAASLVGMDDFDPRLPWAGQAEKFRADDLGVFLGGEPRMDIVERQRSAAGVIWVKVAKVPIRSPAGPTGILGLYQILESELDGGLLSQPTPSTSLSAPA